jgi:UPF0716 protein FxsA
MAGALFALLIVVPVVELWIIVQVAHQIGFLDTLGLLILISIGGAFLLKQQGMATWRRMQTALARGEMPGKEMTDAFLVMLGGALLLTPGFLSDVFGIIFLLPPTRAMFKGVAGRVLAGWVNRRTGGVPRRIYDAKVIRSGRPAGGGSAESARPPGLEANRPDPDPSGDGSPGTG